MNFRRLLPHTPVNKFTQYEGDFQDYIEKMKKVISEGRMDLTGSDAAQILDYNCPYEWKPSQPNGDGVLLVHGLSDSPFMMRDLAQHFLDQGYLVRSLLLPGHGTIPGDILNVRIEDWLNCVKFGIDQTAPIVNKLFLCGFSLGAGLSILNEDKADNIAGIIAIAPGIKVTHRYSFIPKIHKLFSWISDRAKWYLIREQQSHIRYFAYPFHSASLAMKIMHKVRKYTIKTPTFFTISADDETVKADLLVDYFLKHRNAESRFLYYTNDKCDIEAIDPRFEVRHSAYPDQDIIDFSHVCLPISPDNHYLGRHGTFVDVAHYENDNEKERHNVKYGAITAHNITNFYLQRLTYNPDFKYMMQAIDEFMSKL